MSEFHKIEKGKMSLQRYKKLYTRAESDSTSFDMLRAEYLDYTFPAYSGQRNTNEDAGKRFSINLYDSTTLESANGMSQYIKSTLMPDWKKWAKVNPAIMIDGLEPKLDQVYDLINDMLFNYLHISNFSQESGVAINNLVGCGTGALKIMEGTLETPFEFSFVPLKNLSILDGASGKVEKVFYKHTEMTLEKIMDTWNIKAEDIFDDYDEEDDDFDWDKEINVIESCIYLGNYFNEVKKINEDIYHYVVTDESFNVVYKEAFLTYNPFIIVRWSKRDDKTSWGHPIIADILPNVKTLNEAVKNELLGGERAVNPPIFLKNASVNKGEFQIRNGMAYYLPAGADVIPVSFATNYNLSLIKTQELRDSIKNAFINLDSVFATDRNTYKTAEEVARQHYEFTKRYSTVYGKIEKEFLSPILLACFEIMKGFGMIPVPEVETEEEAKQYYELVSSLKITYINPLKKVEDRERVQSVMEFVGIVGQTLGQEVSSLVLNPNVVLEKLKSYMDIDRTFFRTDEEIQQVLQQQQAIQQQMSQEMQGEGEQVAEEEMV